MDLKKGLDWLHDVQYVLSGYGSVDFHPLLCYNGCNYINYQLVS